MKTLIACLSLLCATAAFAQQAGPQVPAPSPGARTDQTVGVTNFSIEYSSPGVKGRKVWGDVVKMDKVWRAGANAPTKLTVSKDFTFGDKKVPAGSYSLFMIPGAKAFTVILNSDLTASQDKYDDKKDVARATINVTAMPAARERLAYIFSDTTEEATNLDMEWEKTRIRMPFKVDTKAIVATNIDAAVDEAWRPHFVAARYLLDSNGDTAKAMGYVDTSIAIKPTWWNHWVKAQLLAKTGKKPEAITTAEKAKMLGKGDQVFESFFTAQVDTAMKGWK